MSITKKEAIAEVIRIKKEGGGRMEGWSLVDKYNITIAQLQIAELKQERNEAIRRYIRDRGGLKQ